MSAFVSKSSIEALIAGDAVVRVSQANVEVLIGSIARDPATPTGAGVTRVSVETLFADSGVVAVTSAMVEVLLSDTSPAPGAGSYAFGYVT